MIQGVFCLCCQGGKRVRNKRSSFFIYFIFTLSSSHDSERWWAEKRRHRYQHYRWLPRLQQYLLFVVDVDVGVCSVWRLRWRPQCWFTLIPPPDTKSVSRTVSRRKWRILEEKLKKKKLQMEEWSVIPPPVVTEIYILIPLSINFEWTDSVWFTDEQLFFVSQ